MLNFQMEFISEIDAYCAALDDAVEVSIHDGAQDIVDVARSLVRVDTGSLQETIDATVDDGATGRLSPHQHAWSVNAGNLEGGYAGGGTYGDRPAGAPVDYAEAQEFGLGGGGFTPFMVPAAEQVFPEIVARTSDNIRAVSGG